MNSKNIIINNYIIMFSRQIYDKGTYSVDLNQWTRPSEYYLLPDSTHRGSATCFQEIPEIVPNNRQFNTTQKNDMINIESDLYNLNRPNSKNPYKKYPYINPKYQPEKIPVCKGTKVDFNIQYPKLEGSQYNREKSIHIPRFESLCLNPQQTNRIRSNNVIGLDTRLYFRDTHQPTIPKLYDKTNVYNTAIANKHHYDELSKTLPNSRKQPLAKCKSC